MGRGRAVEGHDDVVEEEGDIVEAHQDQQTDLIAAAGAQHPDQTVHVEPVHCALSAEAHTSV